jgi:hypothetical protein
MDRNALVGEIKRLNDLLAEANRRAVAQYALIDKLTAANILVQALLRKLGSTRHSPGGRQRRRSTANRLDQHRGM